MKASTIAVATALSTTIAAVYATSSPCDMGAIESSLLPNGTTWHDSCTASTGVDVFMLSSLPTTSQAAQISETRDCVNYINQLNQEANTEIQCTTQVGDQTIVFSELLTDFLKGETGNTTKEATVGSDSGSGSVELPKSESSSGSAESAADVSGSASGSTATKKKKATTSDSGSAESQTGSQSAKTESGAATVTISAVVAAATVVLTFAL